MSMDEFMQSVMEGHHFFQGLSINYGPSNLVTKPGHAGEQGDGSEVAHSTTTTDAAFAKRQALATGLPVGMRFNSFKVRRPGTKHQRRPDF